MAHSLIREFQRFSLRRLPEGRALPCKIYLYLRQNEKMLCLADKALELSRDFLVKYQDREIVYIWISNADWNTFKAFIRESGDQDEIMDTNHDEVSKELSAQEMPHAPTSTEKKESNPNKAKEKDEFKSTHEIQNQPKEIIAAPKGNIEKAKSKSEPEPQIKPKPEPESASASMSESATETAKKDLARDESKELEKTSENTPTAQTFKRDLNRSIERALQKVPKTNANTLRAIFETNKYLPEGSHGLHVCQYALTIALSLGVTDDAELAPLMSAALLHDIGHTQLPFAQTKVADQNANEPEEHIEHSVSLIETLLGEHGKSAAAIVVAHHEKFDGTGYPKKLKGETIPKMAQILAIADRIDQMVSGQWDGVKRSLNDVAKVLDLQYAKGPSVTDFDPTLIQEVVRIITENADALSEIVDEQSRETVEKLMGQELDSMKTRTKAA